MDLAVFAMKDLVASLAQDLLQGHAGRMDNGPVGGDDAMLGIDDDGGLADGLKDVLPFPLRHVETILHFLAELFFGLFVVIHVNSPPDSRCLMLLYYSFQAVNVNQNNRLTGHNTARRAGYRRKKQV